MAMTVATKHCSTIWPWRQTGTSSMALDAIDIRPGVNVLAVLRHLNYRPWYALAEFVDNSVESFVRHRPALEQLHGDDFKLRVEINIDSASPARISIRDNAAGIPEAEYPRAFRPAALPEDRSGLAEFGMGMKSAACWFAPQWSVRTSALGESVSRLVHFDIQNIVTDNIEDLTIAEAPEHPTRHYTEITLNQVFHVPYGNTIRKIRDHLAGIYRKFLRDNKMELRCNRQVLRYDTPAILNAPYFRDKKGPSRLWRKNIAFDFGEGLSVEGFAALRETASTARAGFALFRRSRVIEGSGDEGYRPHSIFGSPNAYRYQRVFGELHLNGFEVSHTKDGFRWDQNEKPFLELLREHLDDGDLPILRQGGGYRVRAQPSKVKKTAAVAVKKASAAIARHLPNVLPTLAAGKPIDTPSGDIVSTARLAARRFDIRFREFKWSILVEITNDPAESQWLTFTDTPSTRGTPRRLAISVSVAHPFMVRFAQTDAEDVEAMLRVAAAIALAEIVARDSGVRNAGTIRRHINDILRDALSEE